MTYDAGRKKSVGLDGVVTTTATESTREVDTTRSGPLGFDAARGLKLQGGGRFNPGRGSVIGGLIDAMRGTVTIPQRLLTLGAVCNVDAAENPAGELFYHIHGGQPYIFSIGSQQERVAAAAYKVAHEGFIRPHLAEGRPVRVFSWSSAQGMIEVYPQDGTPAHYDGNGNLTPHQDAPPGDRPGYNNEHLKKLFFASAQQGHVPDWNSPIEMLQAIDDTDIGTADKPGRAIYVMNGVGPYLREDLDSVTGRGRVYQQLVDLRPRMHTARTSKHIVFNDGPGLMPIKASELGTRFDMTMPTQRMLESTLFAAISNHLFTKVPDEAEQRAPESVTQGEIAKWRAVVGDKIKDETIRATIADGITLEAFERFLPEKKTFAEMGRQLVGFTLPQAQDLVGELVSRASMSESQRLDFDALTKARFDMLKANFNIELVKVDPNLPDPVGLERVMGKLALVRDVFKRGNTRKKPIQPPKMMLLSGIPGMGKSLTAKKASAVLDVPLFRVDLALLFNKFVGQSEENFKRMFDLLESLSPCVVWLDEIEKALGGTGEGSQNVDSGVTDRAHGLLLTWLQEHKQDVFLIGTSNEPDKLSGAVLSRTDEKYFVAFFDEQGAINAWRGNLDAMTDAHNLTDDQLRSLVKEKPSITGREIAQRIGAARELCLAEGKEEELITIDHLRKAMEGWSTAYEQDPLRYREILSLSSAYQAAGLSPVLDPATGKKPEPASEAKREEGGTGRRTRTPAASDTV
jgi:AAA+ superfamily predicted ATPase